MPTEFTAENFDNMLATYIKDLAFAGEDCRDQLFEIQELLRMQGVVIVDVLVEEEKPRSKVLGIF